MDIMLSNFITNDERKEEKKKKKTFGGTDSGGTFSMVFNKSQPVKAIVARKRAVPTQACTTKTAKSAEPPVVEQTNVAQKIPDQPAKIEKSKLHVKPELKVRQKPERKTPQSESKFSLSDEFKKIKTNRKANMFDRLKTQMPKVDLPEVHPLTEKVFSDVAIDSLAIHAHQKKNIADLLGFRNLTVVQNLSVPHILQGRDVLIRAQTGSGKTLAYAMPLVEKLHSQEVRITRTDGILAVVIVPTRELALQTYELFIKLLKPFTWIVSGYLCGGEKRKAEKARLRAGLNILIGTPGRFCDHIKNTESMKLNSVQYLILDEADRMLELGYEKDIKQIVESIKNSGEEKDQANGIQTILLSATLTRSVKELAGLTLSDPIYVDTSDIVVERQFDSIRVEDLEERITIPATVRQSYLVIPPKLRLVTLSGLLAYELNRKVSKALVFLATQDLVDYHYDVMVEVLTQKKPDSDDENDSEDDDVSESESEQDKNGDEAVLLPNVNFFKLHGKMTQIERSSVFREFRSSKSAILLCTDVVARGIDVPSVDLVIQYHAPQILADYVHRVGRTARAGQSGKAVLFLEPSEVEFAKYLAVKQIKLFEEKVDPIFSRIGELLNAPAARKHKNREQASIELQHRYEKLVATEKELYGRACKAFVSWVRYYSNFPKQLRRIFAIKAVNMGHYAKCLGLRDPPKQLVRQQSVSHEEKGSEKNARNFAGKGLRKGPTSNNRSKPKSTKRSPTAGTSISKAASGPSKRRHGFDNDQRQHNKDLAGYAQASRMVNMSEFDSGLTQPARKKARK
ncbi:probable ATP-dependent RNA helicase CG8611 [Sabethes cyaneus]|uniref:probable ATP-dependent RNA helicase CG8611 n=1 Tax=Sabethes cyaneus TaxID=53552 RepID=UPI00237DCBA5|nr:probable ATP-dependent RNA helicase CG8611 [Sabethes cyaneus]